MDNIISERGKMFFVFLLKESIFAFHYIFVGSHPCGGTRAFSERTICPHGIPFHIFRPHKIESEFVPDA